MKRSNISLRRRQLMIAGLAGSAAPAALHAAAPAGEAAPAQAELVADLGGREAVVSGRILAAGGKPLAGAVVEVWRGDADRDAARTTTDGDGRFYATVAPGHRGRPSQIHYRVSRDGETLAAQQLRFARGRQVAEHQAGHLHRDETGAWRAAFGVSLA